MCESRSPQGGRGQQFREREQPAAGSVTPLDPRRTSPPPLRGRVREGGEASAAALIAEIVARFEEAHRQQFGFVSPEKKHIVEALSVEAIGEGEATQDAAVAAAGDARLPAPLATVSMYAAGETHRTPVYDRDALNPGAKVDGLRCQSSEQLLFHIHAHLSIIVNGSPRQVAAGIGIPGSQTQQSAQGPVAQGGTCLYWLHTHAPDGIIHVESPVKRVFTLGDFFDEWGQPLGPSTLGPVSGHVVAIYNGKVYLGNPRAIPLKPAPHPRRCPPPSGSAPITPPSSPRSRRCRKRSRNTSSPGCCAAASSTW